MPAPSSRKPAPVKLTCYCIGKLLDLGSKVVEGGGSELETGKGVSPVSIKACAHLYKQKSSCTQGAGLGGEGGGGV